MVILFFGCDFCDYEVCEVYFATGTIKYMQSNVIANESGNSTLMITLLVMLA